MNLKQLCHVGSVGLTGRVIRLGVASLAVSVVLTACQGLPTSGTPDNSAVSTNTPGTDTIPTLSPTPDWRQRPRLVVVFVIDGLPQRQVLAYRDQLGPDGFARFLDHGAWYADAHHGHAFTVTAAGHSVVLSGAYPSSTGIIANEWRDAMTGQPEYCTGDTRATYIGHATQTLDGTSPKNLKVDTVGDVLRRLDPRAKVIGISGKDRGAILPAGHAGTAYMYMTQTGAFASSTYYMAQHPAWVTAFNAEHPADRWFKKEWKPLLKEEAYKRSLPDRQPWYGVRNALPLMMGAPSDAVPNPPYYSQLLASPFADQLSLEFARAAIEGEGLGQDEVPDILSISLSGHDFVNHRYSAESRFSHDHFLQLDRMLQEFFRDLDRKVGRDQYVALLTADHGFMPAPEQSAKQGLRSGKINGGQLLARLNAGMEQNFGPGKWVSYSGSSLLLNKQLISQQRVDPDEVANTARDLLMEEPGIAVAYTRRELAEGSKPDGAFFTAVRRSWHPDVSGDVQYVVKPYWMFGSSTNVATHGSPYPYDTQVPILSWGPRWVKPGRVDERVAAVDIAPTVAQWLGIAPPTTAEGVVLPVPVAAQASPKDKTERQ